MSRERSVSGCVTAGLVGIVYWVVSATRRYFTTPVNRMRMNPDGNFVCVQSRRGDFFRDHWSLMRGKTGGR